MHTKVQRTRNLAVELHDEVAQRLAENFCDTFLKTFDMDIMIQVRDGKLTVSAKFADEDNEEIPF